MPQNPQALQRALENQGSPHLGSHNVVVPSVPVMCTCWEATFVIQHNVQ